MRLLLLALVFLTAAAPVRAEVTLSVSYSETANLFSIMDNVSGWQEGFTDPAYRAEWTKRFGWSAADQALADQYRDYRLRTMLDDSQDLDPATSSNGIFASSTTNSVESDPLAAYLLGQPDIKTALKNLDKAMTAADAKLLRKFYAHFAPKWRILLAESQPLIDGAAQLNQVFDPAKINPFVERLSRFYNVKTDGGFTVFFTRYPPGPKSSAHVVAGRYFLLHSPSGTKINPSDWDDVVMHELTHYISMRQPSQQKQALTKQFLAICPIPPGIKPLWLLEEPLAVAWGQAAYSMKVRGRPLNPLSNWYTAPWIDNVSRTIAPSVIAGYDNAATINDGIVKEAANQCKNLTAISLLMTGSTAK